MINSTVTKIGSSDEVYPKLMSAPSGNVYLMLTRDRGMLVYINPGKTSQSIGYIHPNLSIWNMKTFEGTVELKNA